MRASVPAVRVTPANPSPIRSRGAFVLYWMTAFRRPAWNFSLQRAVDWCRELQQPLVILEALRCDYPWSSARLHRFVLDGMAANQRHFSRRQVTYFPYVETQVGAGKGLLRALARHACVVVTDDYPCFFLPRMVEAAGQRLDVRLEKVDSNGLLPLRAASKVFFRAYDFRRFLHQQLRAHLAELPEADPLRALAGPSAELPADCIQRWPLAGPDLLERTADDWRTIPLREEVGETGDRGGFREAERRLEQFIQSKLDRYGQERNQPSANATSGLSPWLHFGHVSSHQVVQQVLARAGLAAVSLRPQQPGKVTSWWTLDSGAQEFLDQVITWRELGLNFCWQRSDYMEYDSLPAWARTTLQEHASDPRDPVYSLEQFEHAGTHSALWNAAQRQLRREGRIHNYLRMLWGKKILHWSTSPQEALRIMIHLNDKYALDGRDPNSYSGILWCLGRYDRAWGPERPIFGKVRYMTTASTARKYNVRAYLKRYGPDSAD